MQRAIQMGIEQNVDSFEKLWNFYIEEVDKTANALVDFKNATYKWQAKVWPEMRNNFV